MNVVQSDEVVACHIYLSFCRVLSDIPIFCECMHDISHFLKYLLCFSIAYGTHNWPQNNVILFFILFLL